MPSCYSYLIIVPWLRIFEIMGEIMSDKTCVFCDRSQFEEQLVGETGDFWIIATLGQISDGGYVLLAPKRHISCIGAMEETEAMATGLMEKEIRHALLLAYGSGKTTVFEHGIVGQTIQHAHIHFVPEPCLMTARIREDFPASDMTSVETWKELCGLYRNRQKPYLFWRDCNSQIYADVCWDPPAPSQYLRIVVAQALGRPERANWRTMDPDLDRELWMETVKRLKPYFS